MLNLSPKFNVICACVIMISTAYFIYAMLNEAKLRDTWWNQKLMTFITNCFSTFFIIKHITIDQRVSSYAVAIHFMIFLCSSLNCFIHFPTVFSLITFHLQSYEFYKFAHTSPISYTKSKLLTLFCTTDRNITKSNMYEVIFMNRTCF